MKHFALIATIAGSLALAGCGPDTGTDDTIGTTDMPADTTTSPALPNDAGITTDPAGPGTSTGPAPGTAPDTTGAGTGTGTGTTAP